MPARRSPFRLRSAASLLFLLLAAYAAGSPAAHAATRKLHFETDEVSDPGLGVAPDGGSLVFNLLGHLYRLPLAGGVATQLTFGPQYDSAPAYSPDGKRLAFLSSRDGSDGNLFALELASGVVTPLTRDFQVGAFAWSPDGAALAYVRTLRREEYPAGGIPAGFGNAAAQGVLSEVSLGGGEPRRLGGPRAVVSVFYLRDGRLAWAVAEQGAVALEARAADGSVTRLGALPAEARPAALSSDRSALYYTAGGQLVRYAFGAAQPESLGPLEGTGVRLAAAPDGRSLYAAFAGKLWRVPASGGAPEPLGFRAPVEMETLIPPTPHWEPPGGPEVALREVLTPRLSPDGQTLVFMAAGFLWEQPLAGGPARRLLAEDSYQLEPAFSPDGRELAFVSDRAGVRELRVLERASGAARTLASLPGSAWPLFPSWSPDGKSLVFQRTDGVFEPYRVLRVSAQGGAEPEELASLAGSWTARPQLSADGGALYYTAHTGVMANFYRLALTPGAKPELLTDLSRHVHDAQLSPDGRWLVFRRNHELWLAAAKPGAVLRDGDFRRLSERGGRSFAFTADSTAVVYADGPRVWTQPLASGEARELPLRLALPRVVPPPLLVRGVRVLDVRAGRWSEPSALLLEGGRIRAVGAETELPVPSGAQRVDATGRYAIPGIMDAHTHAAWSNQQISDDALIAYGVTSVRDTGSRLDLVNARLDRAEASADPVPRYFASGDIFEGLMPFWGDAFLEVTTPEEARALVRRARDHGARFIKVYASLPWYLKSVVAQEANRLGLTVAGHGLSVEEIVRSVNLGLLSLEHNGANASDDVVQLLVQSGTWLDPTLTLFGQGTPALLAKPETLDAKLRRFVPEAALAAAQPGRAVSEAQLGGWIERTLGPIRRKHERGLRLLDGTDSLMTSVFHGPSVHWSLQFFGWAGIPAADVLRIGTLRSAEVVGAADQLGSLEPGKLADLLLLDADPLADVANTLRIWRVIAGGQLFDPAALRAAGPPAAGD